ncbi:RagB/SusD family nutrient uptake outer membrane protein [Bacteroides thetaiotaomicron]|nr:RagB/SusD family nutrient uptake outer membrane protein [Bacteroides thetaiotaomicron]
MFGQEWRRPDESDSSGTVKSELAYEGHYYWDMRRWKLSATAFTGIRLHGLKIEQNANGSFNYIYVECDDKDRNFPTKMYRFLSNRRSWTITVR